MKKVLSIIVGYLIFAIGSFMWFRLWKVDPHKDGETWFMTITFLFGIIIAFVSGYVTAFGARSKHRASNYILAAIIAGFAAFSLSITKGSYWTQLMAIFIFAPVSILGGLVYKAITKVR